MTGDTHQLRLFKLKIDEAVNYVPKMHASEKLKAVQFWNVISEKLQDIVNNCAADINAIAVKTQETDSEKMTLEMNNSRPINAIPNCSVSSDFINLPSNYGMCSGITEQYHTIDIGNAQLLTSEATFSIVTEPPVNNNPVTNIPHIHHLNNIINSCERNISDSYLPIESLSQNNYEALGIESCIPCETRNLESVPEEYNKSDCSSKETIQQEIHQICEPSIDTKEVTVASCQSNNVPLESCQEPATKNNKNYKTLKRKKNKKSLILRNSLLNKNVKYKLNCDNKRNNVLDISEGSLDSVKSGLRTAINSRGMDSNHADGFEPCVPSEQRGLESVSKESIKNSDYNSEGINQKVHQIYENTKEITSTSCQNNNMPFESYELVTQNNRNNRTLKRKKSKKSLVLKHSHINKNFKSESNCDKMNQVSDVSESSLDSVKSNFKTAINSGDSDSNHAEPIVSFVVSSSEEILAKNGLTPELVDCPGDKLPDSLKSYSCSDCPARFAAKGNLIVHMRRHTGEKPYSCVRCSARFTTKGNLKRHSKTHTGEKPFECLHCGGTFTEKKSLIVHMRRHTGEKPYECKVCGKRFAQTGILQTHMAMHLNQKFHLCEHCGKSFRQRSQLLIHKLRHENIRKYGCTLCTSRFLTKGDLERHMRTHTGERPYVCEICSKAFTRQQSLNEHLNRHNGIRPYSCKYCSKTFTEMSACYKHIKQHEKAAVHGSKVLPTESSIPTSKLPESNQVDSNGSSYEIVRLTRCDSPKPSETNELSEDNDENAVNNQSLASFIENFFQ